MIALALLLGVGLGSVAYAKKRVRTAAVPEWHSPVSQKPVGRTSSAAAAPEPTEETAAESALTLSATGDIMMSNAPTRVPPNDGEGFFDSVRDALDSDLVMGNLEQPLTENTGASKCGTPPDLIPNCFAFRSPPGYAKLLSAAGFDLVNTANNHARDFGVQGYRNTRAALDAAGVLHTGAEDEITVVERKGIKVAVLGFSPYAGTNNLNDLTHAATVVKSAKQQADLVVVQVHMGAEGAAMQHVKPGNELFHGENRGDPIRFSHAVIDAGADLVVGHSPHVLRAMEFYKGKLIAYSLGNFAGGGHTLSSQGVLKYGGILQVTINADGTYGSGRFLSTYMNSAGLPTRDASAERGRRLVADLSAQDFPSTGARIGADGSITRSA